MPIKVNSDVTVTPDSVSFSGVTFIKGPDPDDPGTVAYNEIIAALNEYAKSPSELPRRLITIEPGRRLIVL